VGPDAPLPFSIHEEVPEEPCTKCTAASFPASPNYEIKVDKSHPFAYHIINTSELILTRNDSLL